LTPTTLSQDGIALIANSEGRRLTAYKCPAGVWTVGYGHTSAQGSPEVYPGLTITKEEADEILFRDIHTTTQTIAEHVKVRLTQSQFDALVSFIYNVGAKRFIKSTLLKKLNEGDYAAIPSQLARWVYSRGKVSKGLVNRRQAEADMWIAGMPESKRPDAIPQVVTEGHNRPITSTSHVTAAGVGSAATGLWSSLPDLAHYLHDPVLWHHAIVVVIGLTLFGLGIVADRYILHPVNHSETPEETSPSE